MTPFRFGAQGRQLFGAFHAPSGATKSTAILLCNPFGQEALRAQRMFRLLADRMSRNGYPTLRFDYYGTGDSDGECTDADCTDWIADIATADRELLARSGARRSAWIGLGLGATLAAHASSGLPRDLAGLFLWDAIVDTTQYVRDLQHLHDQSFERALPPGFRFQTLTSMRQEDEIVDQLLGFPITARLRDSLVEAGKRPREPIRAERVTLLAADEDHAAVAVTRAWLVGGRNVSHVPVRRWATANFDDLVASGLVYGDVIQTLSGAVGTLP